MESIFVSLVVGIFVLGLFHLILDFYDDSGELEQNISFYTLMGFVTLVICLFLFGSVLSVKADTVYDGSEFDWVYKQGDADSLGFSGGLFVDNKRLLKALETMLGLI